MDTIESLKEGPLPEHLAIIMDGNGRWAKERGKMRVFGHENGVRAVRQTVESAAKIGIKFLTLYAFSTENWNRPKMEVDTLMRLLVSSLRKELKTLTKNNIRLNAIGLINTLPEKALEELEEVIHQTRNNDAMTLTLALSYGSREELTSAFRDLASKVKNNIISSGDIDETIINKHLYTHDLPDVDLLIRTSGEYRISNFLKVFWPDFSEAHLIEAIKSYQNRERRFGKTSEQLN
jgi:undecaprenyl diphosphate synthase